ncbi:hypothetical protein [Heyndrickxia oleronia]
MKSTLIYFIIVAIVIHGILDVFDGVHWIYRLINLCFLFIIVAILNAFVKRLKKFNS